MSYRLIKNHIDGKFKVVDDDGWPFADNNDPVAAIIHACHMLDLDPSYIILDVNVGALETWVEWNDCDEETESPWGVNLDENE